MRGKKWTEIFKMVLSETAIQLPPLYLKSYQCRHLQGQHLTVAPDLQ